MTQQWIPAPPMARLSSVRARIAGALMAGPGSADAGPSEDEEDHEEADPHPDTPDDFDEDAGGERESIEAVVGDEPSARGLPGGLSADPGRSRSPAAREWARSSPPTRR